MPNRSKTKNLRNAQTPQSPQSPQNPQTPQTPQPPQNPQNPQSPHNLRTLRNPSKERESSPPGARRIGTALSFAAAILACAGCSLRGARKVTEEGPVRSIVSFGVPRTCSITIGKSDRLRTQEIHLVAGGNHFELLLLNSLGRGYRLTNHEFGNEQHQFSIVGRENIWTLSFPDRAGEPGLVREYARPSGSSEPSPAHLKEYCALDSRTFFPEARHQEAP